MVTGVITAGFRSLSLCCLSTSNSSDRSVTDARVSHLFMRWEPLITPFSIKYSLAFDEGMRILPQSSDSITNSLRPLCQPGRFETYFFNVAYIFLSPIEEITIDNDYKFLPSAVAICLQQTYSYFFLRLFKFYLLEPYRPRALKYNIYIDQHYFAQK